MHIPQHELTPIGLTCTRRSERSASANCAMVSITTSDNVQTSRLAFNQKDSCIFCSTTSAVDATSQTSALSQSTSTCLRRGRSWACRRATSARPDCAEVPLCIAPVAVVYLHIRLHALCGSRDNKRLIMPLQVAGMQHGHQPGFPRCAPLLSPGHAGAWQSSGVCAAVCFGSTAICLIPRPC